MTDKVKLGGGPEKTVSWIGLDPETGGQLKVELYDFSESAQRMFGNGIASTITVNDMEKLLATVNQNEASIIPWMEQYFKSYFGIKQGLEKNEIDFRIERESWT